MMKVFVTRKIPQNAIEILKEHFEVQTWEEDRAPKKEELIENIKDVFGILCLLTDEIDKEVIEKAKNLKIISNYAVGIDNIDIKYATQKGIIVTNTPDVLTQATAELAWALLFAVARRIVEGDRFVREGKFKGWEPLLFLGKEIHQKTLGVIGAGRIGTAFALKSKGFDMRVVYFSRNENEVLQRSLCAEKKSLHEVLREAHFVSLHVPLTNETYHLIDKEEFKLMRKDAIIINTSRGAVINEEELVKALKEKRIAGAGLDVYENEPKIHPELLTLENVVLLPHIGSATYHTRKKMAEMAARSIVDFYKGRIPKNAVNASF